MTPDPQTNRELAEKQIRRFQEALRTGRGHPGVCRDMLDKWLEFLADDLREGTADDRRPRL